MINEKKDMDANNYSWNSIEYIGYLGGASGERLPHKPLRQDLWAWNS
jgi:hypothetical protein